MFDLIYVLTANSRDTMSMSVYARQQLVDFQEVGLGSAASTLIFLIIALLVVVTMVVGRRAARRGCAMKHPLPAVGFWLLGLVIALFSPLPVLLCGDLFVQLGRGTVLASPISRSGSTSRTISRCSSASPSGGTS